MIDMIHIHNIGSESPSWARFETQKVQYKFIFWCLLVERSIFSGKSDYYYYYYYEAAIGYCGICVSTVFSLWMSSGFWTRGDSLTNANAAH